MKTRTLSIKIKEYKVYTVDNMGRIEIVWSIIPANNVYSFDSFKKAKAYARLVNKEKIEQLKRDIKRFKQWIKEASLELDEAEVLFNVE